MNTFKKIAAVTMAAATLATTMVSASALADIYFGSITPTYDASKAYQVSEKQIGANEIYFSDVSKNLSTGNIVLSINTTANLATEAGSRELRQELCNLNLLLDVNDSPILQDKYPLEIVMGGRNKANIIVGSNNVFNYLDFTSVRAVKSRHAIYGECMMLYVDYEIEDYNACILPNFEIHLGGLSNPNKSASHTVNDWNDWADGPVTKGTLYVYVPKYETGKTVYATINGVKVAKVEVPKFDSVGANPRKVNYTNY